MRPSTNSNQLSTVGPTASPRHGGTHLMSTSYRGTHPVVEESRWPRSVPAPEHSRHRSSISSPSVFFSGEQVRQRRRGMSSSASSHRSWPRYGAVPMRRCPDCPRTAPLKRLVTSTDKNGNIGREFVKCESKPEPGKVRSECSERQFLAFLSKFHAFHQIWELGFISAISGTAKMWAF